MRDLMKELDEFDGTYPESWRSKPGDKIEGIVRRYDQGESPYGPRWIVVLECQNAGGEPYLSSVWLSHAVLVDRFKKLRPKVGERLAIKRLDDHPDKGYARFNVLVDRPGAEVPNWDMIEAVEPSGGSECPEFP